MNKLMRILLGLALCAALVLCAAAEGALIPVDALSEDDESFVADQEPCPAEEIEALLPAPDEGDPDEYPEEEAEIDAPEPLTADGEVVYTDDPTAAVDAPAEGEEADAPETESNAPAWSGEPLTPVRIKLTKDTSKTVFLGIPYQLTVKDDIKSVKSNATGVATVTADGRIDLLDCGTARLTVKTSKGKKLKLTLKVQPAPAPGEPKVAVKGNHFTLKWSEARYATGYLIQQASGKAWEDRLVVPKDKASVDIGDYIAEEAQFRVIAVLGDHLGGASESVRLLGPVSGLKVICAEKYKTGPEDRLNILWDAVPGATGYAVYRAKLPSDDYRLLGTTDDTWIADTRSETKLYAYRVKPLCLDLDLPMSDPVTLWSGMEDNVLPPSSLESDTGILILVNKKAQVVTAYVQDAKGRYTIPLRHMICSTGKSYNRTKNGTYQLRARQGEWYRYPNGTYIRWPSIYRDGYYFHSVLYTSGKKIMACTVDRLGTRQSLGCIRLKVRDAEWMYRNCKAGTTVYICDGAARTSLMNALEPRTVNVK